MHKNITLTPTSNLTETREMILRSYGLVFHDKAPGIYINYLENGTLDGFITVTNPKIGSHFRVFTKKRLGTAEDYPGFAEVSDNTILELGILRWIWYWIRFNMVKLLYYPEFRRQNKRYVADKVKGLVK